MIKYIGSKRALLAEIVQAVSGVLPEGGTVCDLFSGSARVGHALKKQGFRVWSNDHNAYAHVLATAYVQADRERWLERAEGVLAELRTVAPEAGGSPNRSARTPAISRRRTGRGSTPCATASPPWRWSPSWRPSRWSV